jgi:hypothetical protein
MNMGKIDIDIKKVKEAFNDNPKKKKAAQTALSMDRQTMSKILNQKQGLRASEFLTFAAILERNPFDFALEK